MLEHAAADPARDGRAAAAAACMAYAWPALPALVSAMDALLAADASHALEFRALARKLAASLPAFAELLICLRGRRGAGSRR